MKKNWQIESFFSPHIKKLYEQPDEAAYGDRVSNFSEVEVSLISKWNKQILSDISLFKGIEELYGSVKWYEECVKIIQSYRSDFWNYILFLGPVAVKWPYLKWVGHEIQFQNVIDNFNLQMDAGDHYISILIATSLAERILRNIYLMEGKTIPFLLRDILDSVELKLILGNSLVDLLKVLIGSVNGLNFRNIAWHGFLSPKDIHSDYAAIIVYALHLCGNKISMSNRKIVTRPYLSLQKVCQPLENKWKNIEISYVDVLNVFETSMLVPSIMKQLWIKALNLLLYRKTDAIVLLLPLLENSLRLLYASICNCPRQVLTATNSEFYLTLDEILSPWQMASYSKSTSLRDELQSGYSVLDQTLIEDCEITNELIHCGSKESNNIDQNDFVKCNKVPQLLGKQLTEALYDLFILPSGPRIRDRVSHGEVLPDSVPFNLTVYLFKLCLLILTIDKWRFTDEFAELALFTIKCQCESISKKDLCSHHYSAEIDDCVKDYFLQMPKTKIENSLISSLVVNLSCYRSIYHPASELRSRFLSILECLSTWKEWDFPKCENFIVSCNWEEYKTKYSDLVINFGNCLNISDSTASTFCYKSSFELIDIIQTFSQTVLFSANSELEVLKLMQRITNNILNSIDNICCSLKTKLELFLVKSLRSRQRENYKRQLEVIPDIVDNINFNLNILVMIYINKNRIALLSKPHFNLLVKLLKKILKLFENLVSYSEVTVNKYHESLSILKDNTSYLLKHFVKE